MTSPRFWLLVAIFAVVGFLAEVLIDRRRGIRKPWVKDKEGRLLWLLSPLIRRQPRPYWPPPTCAADGWRRPAKRSYCLRCGTWPWRGPIIYYDQTQGKGMQTICSSCWGETTPAERKEYAKLIVDIWFCQDYDPHMTHVSKRKPPSHYQHVWDGVEDYFRRS